MVAIQTYNMSGPINIEMKPMSDADFLRFCRNNPDYRIERNKHKQPIIMPPTGSDTGNFNSEFNFEPTAWNRKFQKGYGFDSSAGFTLPNGAIRSPDFSWIKKERWETLTPQQKRGFAHICPDFVVEIASPSDNIRIV
jgi:Uma2 family endonuclease